MNRKNILQIMALALTIGILVSSASFAQTRATAADDTSTFLPPSDGIMVIDLYRLLSEILPRVFAGDSAKLAQINSEIDRFKAETGVDPRSLTKVVVGTHYVYPSPTVTRMETVAIAHGSFDPKAIAAAGRAKTQGRYREEQYRGSTIMIFGIGDQMKLFGLMSMKVTDLAVCALDAKTLAIGSVTTVGSAIDAGRAGVRANNDLITLAKRDPNEVIGFGANITGRLTANLNVGSDAMAADINAIRQVYGSIGSTQRDVSLVLTARTETAAAAKNLSDTVTGLKQLASVFIVRMAPPRKALAQSALDNLKITTRGNELEIRTQFAAANLASVVK